MMPPPCNEMIPPGELPHTEAQRMARVSRSASLKLVGSCQPRSQGL